MKYLIAILGVATLILLFGALFALPVMWLWNWLLPGLFGFKTVGWLQAWGLVVLAGLLFRSGAASQSSK